MVGILKRMRTFNDRVRAQASLQSTKKKPTNNARPQILKLRYGPGALLLPHRVKALSLSFAFRMADGHMGPRKFWKEYLPRLKFHNPGVRMTVARTRDQSAPATMTVTLGDGATAPGIAPAAAGKAASSTAAPPAEEKTEDVVVDVKGMHSAEMFERFREICGGKEVVMTEEDKVLRAELDETAARSQRDREMQAEVLRKKRREQEILEQARRSVEMSV